MAIPFALLVIFWLALSGHYTFLLIGFGIASCAFVTFIVWRMDIADHKGHPLYLISLRVFPYYIWLLKEILVSSFTVARMAVSSKMNIDTKTTFLDAKDLKEIEKVVYANSITLTPGTLTIDVTDTHLQVHTIRADLLDSLERGDMKRRVLNTTVYPWEKK